MEGEKESTILVVDDEQSILTSLQLLLQDDYQVITATTGKEALQYRNQVGLIISDVQLPDIDGVTLEERMSADQDSAPGTIFMSGKTREQLEKEGIQVPPNAPFFQKPFHDIIAEFLSRVEEMLGKVA